MTKVSNILLMLLCILSIHPSYAQLTFNSSAPSKRVIVGQGPEDLQIDSVNQRLIIACAEHDDDHKSGSIWSYYFIQEKLHEFEITPTLPFHFQPHGVDLIHKNDTVFLFVINHRTKKESEIDRFIIADSSLVLDKRFKNIIGSPNDLIVLGMNEFVYSDYHFFNGGLVHYSNDEPKVILGGLHMPNGLCLIDSTIYFATTVFGKLYSSDLTSGKKEKILRLKGADNITVVGDGSILVATHPNFTRFSLHAINNHRRSPSLVYNVNLKTEKATKIFFDNGGLISAASTALLFDKKLYLGQIFNDYFLVLQQ